MITCTHIHAHTRTRCGGVQVVRVGPMHQAGSDSMLTLAVYFKLVEKFFGRAYEESKFCGILYGLGVAASIL